MSEQANPAFGWKCPTCGRRVPRRVTTCRCGHEQSDAERAAADDASATQVESTIASAESSVLVRAVGVVAILGIVYWLGMRAARPRPVDAPIARTTPAAAPPPTITVPAPEQLTADLKPVPPPPDPPAVEPAPFIGDAPPP